MDKVTFTIDNLWIMIAAALVFIMNLGFACLETGLIRSKNATNVLFKNTVVPIIGLLTFGAWGFSIMWHPGYNYEGSILAWGGLGLTPPMQGGSLDLGYDSHMTFWTQFLFQAMFASTAATIVSGAVAERIKLVSFLIFSIVFLSVVYPVVGFWAWGGGWLANLAHPFKDFAGSSVVHSVGGYGALIGAIMLGPRIGKYVDGKILPLPGHNMALAVIGLFMLWLGWFGFNGGSVLSADPATVSLVLVTTCFGAAAGCVGAFFCSFLIFRTLDITLSINGILAGLVGITA
jgi:Amt family ammonium transporter